MRARSIFLILALAVFGCQSPPTTAPSSDPLDAGIEGSAPSFMDATSVDVVGHGCAYTTDEWTDGRAAPLLDARWSDLGALFVDGAILTSPTEFRDHVARAEPADAARAILLLNLAMNEAGVYGQYADLANARTKTGPHHGLVARDLTRLPAAGTAVMDASDLINEGFAGCPTEWYYTSYDDTDNDGIIEDYDCDDNDATVGQSLLEDGLDEDTGYFSPSSHLDGDWIWDGTSAYVSDGGQQALLGAAETWDDVVVSTTLTSMGTEPGCGYDCLSSCGAYVPDDCYSDWQALGLGILSAVSTDPGTITYYNTSPDHDICFDGFLMWDAPFSQGLTIGEELLDNSTYRIPAGGSLQVRYASWTTDNNVYEAYLGEASFWCYQAGSLLEVGVPYESIGALLPEDMQWYIQAETDRDGDGVEDHVDWANAWGVQSQHNLWDYQDGHAAFAMGKLAQRTAMGTVAITLTAQNRGALPSSGTLTDTLPRNWRIDSCDLSPDTEVIQADDTTTLTWELSLNGCVSDCAVFDEVVIECELVHNLDVDLNIVELPAASLYYNDGVDMETSWSMPAAAFDYDHDGDGQVLCGDTDRWRAGVLLRANIDQDQNEGFHAYRCTLSHNAQEDAYPEGHFLQIAEFMDALEDEIASECDPDSDENPTFDELARVDHDGTLDISAGDVATLSFRAVGDDLYCVVEDDQGAIYMSARAEGAATSFSSGGTGLSTLNMFGDYQDVVACEAYALP